MIAAIKAGVLRKLSLQRTANFYDFFELYKPEDYPENFGIYS